MAPELNPVMAGFINVKSHIGKELTKIGGNAGPIASTVTKLYMAKAGDSKSYDSMSDDEKLDFYKIVKNVFDSDSESNRKAALSEAQSMPRKPRKVKKTNDEEVYD